MNPLTWGKGRKDRIDARSIPVAVMKLVVAKQGGEHCNVCGAEGKLEVDHRIPLSRGGDNHWRNLQLLCVPCNRKKGAALKPRRRKLSMEERLKRATH